MIKLCLAHFSYNAREGIILRGEITIDDVKDFLCEYDELDKEEGTKMEKYV